MPLKIDQIYPHFKHKAVVRVRNYLKDLKSVNMEGQKLRETFRALIYIWVRHVRFTILTVEGMKD